jgi:hypothetical protein
MKRLNILFAVIMGLMSTILINSCTKSYTNYTPWETDLTQTSQVQVFIATVNANRNLVTVDGKRVSRPTLSSGTSFPTAVYPSTNTGYSFTVPGGLRTFSIVDTLVTTTQRPLVFAQSLDPGKHYTVFMYDTITSPKQVTVETNIEIPSDNTARLRFANFIHDVNAVPAVEVFSKRRNEVLFTNINKTEVTPFISYSSVLNDTLLIRPVGSATVLTQFNGFLPTQKRSYTLVYRGSHRGTKAATVFANY